MTALTLCPGEGRLGKLSKELSFWLGDFGGWTFERGVGCEGDGKMVFLFISTVEPLFRLQFYKLASETEFSASGTTEFSASGTTEFSASGTTKKGGGKRRIRAQRGKERRAP